MKIEDAVFWLCLAIIGGAVFHLLWTMFRDNDGHDE